MNVCLQEPLYDGGEIIYARMGADCYCADKQALQEALHDAGIPREWML